MVYLPRRARWTALASVLLSACAGGAEDSAGSISGFASQGPGSNPVVTGTGTDDGSTTMSVPTEGTGRVTTTEEPRETTTETPEPGTTTTDPSAGTTGPDETGVATTDDGGDDSTTGPVVLCGNGMIDAPEECDGANLGGKDCKALGFTGGTLVCTPQCIFDKAMCTSPSCGDGTVDAGEECDCGNQGAQCTAAQLGNTMCTTLPSPNGSNYSAGNLACNSPNSCSFNKAGCVYCGDGIKNAAEACDGGDLGGQTCASQGFVGGQLTCNPQCGLNTGACTTCGNNVVDAGEVCDGGNFNGQTCQSIDGGKFVSGSLSCSGCNSIGTGSCSSGNCCVVGGAGACAAPTIKNCVCALDSYCCNNSWDSICVGEAKNNCGAQCP